MKKTLVYLAVPYSHPDTAIRELRFYEANVAAAKLMQVGWLVFSPISHTHPIALAGTLPLGWEYWKDYDETMLSLCHVLFVLTLNGWKESKGITNELAYARAWDIPVFYLSPVDGVLTSHPQ